MQFLSSLTQKTAQKAATALVATSMCFGAAGATAQSLFSPAITVDENAITYFELEQRLLFLQLLGAPEASEEGARTLLINEHLQENAYRLAGIEVGEEEIEAGMEQFAARAQLTTEEFIQALGEGGVEPQTFRSFVRTGLGWRELIRARFLGRARPTDAEIDRALAADGGAGGVRVLLSEVIIPITPETLDAVRAQADRIAQITDTAAFSAEARRFSATETAENGGRMNWMALSDLPPQLRPQILAGVTSPGDAAHRVAERRRIVPIARY